MLKGVDKLQNFLQGKYKKKKIIIYIDNIIAAITKFSTIPEAAKIPPPSLTITQRIVTDPESLTLEDLHNLQEKTQFTRNSLNAKKLCKSFSKDHSKSHRQDPSVIFDISTSLLEQYSTLLIATIAENTANCSTVIAAGGAGSIEVIQEKLPDTAAGEIYLEEDDEPNLTKYWAAPDLIRLPEHKKFTKAQESRLSKYLIS